MSSSTNGGGGGGEEGKRKKSIIVTGGASGIGLSMARHFLSQGHSVAVLDISGQSVVAQLSTEYCSAVKLAIHYMNQNPKTPGSRGSIICTASNAGIYPFPTAPLYAAAKAGVIGLVRSTARNLERVGIQINALAPAVLDTNIAPDKKLFKHMIVTPMSTLIAGVDRFLGDPSLSGEVAEIHGDSVSLRASPEWVDEDSKKNVEMFWTLGYA